MPPNADAIRDLLGPVPDGRARHASISDGLAPLFLEAFAALEAEEVPYCVLRVPAKAGNHQLQEVDVLFDPRALARLRRVLQGKGFAPIPGWGHAPHHFFVAYDAASDTWLKLDCVDDLRYGDPIRSLPTGWPEDCLRRRRRQGKLFVAAPEYAFLKHLLHFLMDDEAGLYPVRKAKLAALYDELQRSETAARRAAILVDRHFAPALSWAWIRQAISSGAWKGLAARRAALKGKLFWQSPLRSFAFELSGRLLRLLRPLLFALLHRGFAVALLAPDGAGKTTVAQALARDEFLKARVIYMGTNPARRSLRWPRMARADSSQRRTRFAARLAEHWARCLMAWYHLFRGRFVVFDRFPIEGRLHSEAPTPVSRLRRFLLEAGCPPPDMVCLLDAPAEVLYLRKPEHKVEWLEHQRNAYLRLREHVPGAVVVDAAVGAPAVKTQITSHVWKRSAEARRPA